MSKTPANDYDVIIIGAGISGLVCGCYLAKAGLKTLIVEKNLRVGGYCASFASSGFEFDTFAHALSSLRPNGRLFNLLNEINVLHRIKVMRNNPSEVILSGNYKINVYHDQKQTMEEFKRNFVDHKSTEHFFNFILGSSDKRIIQLRNKTFSEFIRSYIKDAHLIRVLEGMLYLITGVDSKLLSGVVGCFLIREFIFDGGYYPLGGMQEFSDILSSRFKESGGKVTLKSEVKKVIIDGGKARGIVLKDGCEILSTHIVGACDIRQLLIDMVSKEYVPKATEKRIKNSKISTSGFLLYLGLKSLKDNMEVLSANHYIINTTNFLTTRTKLMNIPRDFVITSPSIKKGNKSSRISVCLTTNALKNDFSFKWKGKKEEFRNHLLSSTDKIFPGLSATMIFEGASIPSTLENWTRSFNGAAFGLASTCDQFQSPDFSQKTNIPNLFIVGQWSNYGSGIPMVAFSAAHTAKTIINKLR